MLFRRARALMSQGFATMAKADQMMARGDAMMAAADKVLAAVGADMEDFLKELADGVDLELVWGKFETLPDGSTKLPLKLRITVKE